MQTSEPIHTFTLTLQDWTIPVILKRDHVCMGHFTLAVPPACPQHYVGGLH